MIYDTIKALCKKRGLSVTSVEKEAGLAHINDVDRRARENIGKNE